MAAVFDDNEGILRRLRFAAITVAICAVVAGGALVADWWVHGTESIGTRARTSQFYGFLQAEPRSDYANVLAIGHNSGESTFTARRALEFGADVIEIDVAWQHGRLIAAHDSPSGLGGALFRGMTLEQAWANAQGARLIQLDLKEATPAYRDLVATFLANHADDHAVMVTSRDPEVLRMLADREPEVLRFLSIGTAGQFTALLDDPDLAAILDGVSIRHTLVDEPAMAALTGLDLVVSAWTVNSLARVDDLVDLGVRGITTDNLAILQAIRASRAIDSVVGPIFDRREPDLGYS